MMMMMMKMKKRTQCTNNYTLQVQRDTCARRIFPFPYLQSTIASIRSS